MLTPYCAQISGVKARATAPYIASDERDKSLICWVRNSGAFLYPAFSASLLSTM